MQRKGGEGRLTGEASTGAVAGVHFDLFGTDLVARLPKLAGVQEGIAVFMLK